MAGIFRSFVQSLLKLVNSIIAMAGMAIVLYGLWMLRVWHQRRGSSPSDNYTNPWFIYSFLGLGIAVCLITCTGHIAAETSHGCCLYTYMVFLFCLFMLEAVLTADVLLNHNWAEGLSFLLAFILKALGPYTESYYVTDDEDLETSRVPLLRNSSHSPYVVGDVYAKK